MAAAWVDEAVLRRRTAESASCARPVLDLVSGDEAYGRRFCCLAAFLT